MLNTFYCIKYDDLYSCSVSSCSEVLGFVSSSVDVGALEVLVELTSFQNVTIFIP